MRDLTTLAPDDLRSLKSQLEQEYAAFKAKGLSLNMARGKPSSEQLDLSMPLLDVLNSSSDLTTEDGIDCRNYGVSDGIPEAKRLRAAMLDDDPIIYLIPSNEIGSLFSMTVDNLTAVEETEEETDAESGTETETDTQSDTTTD